MSDPRVCAAPFPFDHLTLAEVYEFDRILAHRELRRGRLIIAKGDLPRFRYLASKRRIPSRAVEPGSAA